MPMGMRDQNRFKTKIKLCGYFMIFRKQQQQQQREINSC